MSRAPGSAFSCTRVRDNDEAMSNCVYLSNPDFAFYFPEARGADPVWLRIHSSACVAGIRLPARRSFSVGFGEIALNRVHREFLYTALGETVGVAVIPPCAAGEQ